jgi:integrase
MPLLKQAKTFTKAQVQGILGHLDRTRHPVRNRVIFLLSAKAGLRAKEIASLTWEMLTDADGTVGRAIRLEDRASKGRSGRVIPMNQDLRNALIAWQSVRHRSRTSTHVVSTERSTQTSPQAIVNLFSRWFRDLRYPGCSSHSGRRTFITNAARKISTVGGSLLDVQTLAGHASIRTTQRYIEAEVQAQQQIVDLI